MKTTARRLRVVRPDEASGTAPRRARSDPPPHTPPNDPSGSRSPDAATEEYWSRVQALRAALDDLRPVG